jgi:hypothetical protein
MTSWSRVRHETRSHGGYAAISCNTLRELDPADHAR